MRSKLFSILILLAPLVTAGCATGPKSGGISLRTSDGSVLVGTITEQGNNGSIRLSNASGLSCSSAYTAPDGPDFPAVPLQCSDGRVGIARFQRAAVGHGGIGRVTFQDGSSAEIGVGDSAQSIVTAQPVAASLGDVSGGNASVSTPNSSLGVSGSGGSSGCISSNSYGAISCTTGLPRTERVSGYFRRDGTYVSPYFRSRR
jgi:hypothetical protein